MLRAGHAEGSAGDAATRMLDARQNVREVLRKLERLVSKELAEL
jgi:hypothetical protein